MTGLKHAFACRVVTIKTGYFIFNCCKTKKQILTATLHALQEKLYLFLLVAPVFFLTSSLQAQAYNYTKYDIKDGLPSNTIYEICQDADGFLWFATDAGVARYDGMQFKNFRSADGLPDNEILRVHADKKGRVWIAPFKNKLCYYKNGKIYTEDNDAILKQIKLSAFVIEIIEDNQGNILVYDYRHVYIIRQDDSVLLLPISEVVSVHQNGYHPGFILVKKDTTFSYNYKAITIRRIHSRDTIKGDLWLDVDSSENEIFIQGPRNTIQLTRESVRARFVSTAYGAYQIARDKPIIEKHYLPNEKVVSTFEDDEKNIWFSIPGKGLLKLASPVIYNYISSAEHPFREIYSVSACKGKIVAGGSDCRLYLFSPAAKTFTITDLVKFRSKVKDNSSLSRAYCSQLLSTGDCIIGFDDFLAKLSPAGKIDIQYIHPVKAIAEAGPHLIIATGRGIIRIRKSDLMIIDTLYHQRATTVCCINKTIYFGTLSGLYKINEDKTIHFLGENEPLLNVRIASVVADDKGIVWVATYNNGIVALANDKVVQQLNAFNYLSSNNCRSLCLDKRFLWVGTSKGICRLTIDSSVIGSVSYRQSQGLPSDIINAISVDDSMVYAGTPAGLAVFDKKLLISKPGFRLKLMGVTIGDSIQYAATPEYTASYGKRIRIDYSIIAFRSNDVQSYVYRVDGVSPKWDTTTNSAIEFSYLPPGDFVVEVKAINNKGETISNELRLPLTVSTPFWKNKLFLSLVAAVVFLLGWLGIYVWLKMKGREEKRKKDIRLEMLELQQKALRAQMNPHFIFNCLNKVQDFLFTQDAEPANRFLVNLSSLIRQTLENSGNSFISIADEMRYLTTYLELEKTRFDNSFNFYFLTGNSLRSRMEALQIPTMIIQPYLENAIKHGISQAKSGQGKITIEATLTDSNWVKFVITDNGIGINKARATATNGQHISRGMELTAERVQTVTQITGRKILITVKDGQLEEAATGLGTQVQIIFEI